MISANANPRANASDVNFFSLVFRYLHKTDSTDKLTDWDLDSLLHYTTDTMPQSVSSHFFLFVSMPFSPRP